MSFNFVLPCQVDVSYATQITTIKNESLTTPKLISPLIQDVSGNTGSLGQVLNATTTGIKWNPPAVRVAGGGSFTTHNIPITAAQNFFVLQQNITSNTTSAKYLITCNFTMSGGGAGDLFATIGRQQGADNQVSTTTRNLADGGFISANNISTPPYFLSSTHTSGSVNRVSLSMTLVDSPAYVGTLSYGLWVRASAGNIIKFNMTVVQVEP